jgi:hypothetical protein
MAAYCWVAWVETVEICELSWCSAVVSSAPALTTPSLAASLVGASARLLHALQKADSRVEIPEPDGSLNVPSAC